MGDYYGQVADHFDEEAAGFDERYWRNPVLQRIRQAFREQVKRLPFARALEIGCGTGLDLAHFASIYPQRTLIGLDVSPEMTALARRRLEDLGLGNAVVEVGNTDQIGAVCDGAVDVCYIFFGALNTVDDLNVAADQIYEAVRPGGHLVLTFVNRWYLVDILAGLVRGQWRRAFARLRPVWGGYSSTRFIPSRCVGPGDVRRAFGRGGRRLERKGFSILYLAWYRHRWLKRLGRAGYWLWRVDEWLNRTPLWMTGEYALYVYQKSD